MNAYDRKGQPLKISLPSSWLLSPSLPFKKWHYHHSVASVSVFFQRFFVLSLPHFLFNTDNSIPCALLCTLLFHLIYRSQIVPFSYIQSCLCGRNITAQWLSMCPSPFPSGLAVRWDHVTSSGTWLVLAHDLWEAVCPTPHSGQEQ